MQSTEKRIAALEAQKAPTEKYTLIRRFVSLKFFPQKTEFSL